MRGNTKEVKRLMASMLSIPGCYKYKHKFEIINFAVSNDL